MNYIYNLRLNFKNKFYDFFEWNQEDIIKKYSKVPIFKITEKDYINMKYNIIIIKNFQTNHISIFSNGQDLIAIKFNNKGYNFQKSDICLDQQETIIKKIKNQKIMKISYKVIKKNKESFKTRKEIENKNKLLKMINKIYTNKEYHIINYIHMECFNKKGNNIQKMYLKIKKEITKGNSNFYKILNIIKLIPRK